MSDPVMILCHGCKTVSAVNRVTATLRCTCGSDDLDLAPAPAGPTFLEYMGAAHGPGTGWGADMPDPLKGWSQYAGPMPGPNPWGHPATPVRCTNCQGSGWSLKEKCRACGGTGTRTPPTAVAPEPQVARHPGQTKRPFMGKRRRVAGRPKKDPNAPPTNQEVLQATVPGFGERGMKQPTKPHEDPYGNEEGRYPGADKHSPLMQTWSPGKYSDEDLRAAKPYPMHDASCPNCGDSPTHLIKDHNEDAWWHCPNCGPLANIDKHPDVDPYADHGDSFQPEKGFKAQGRKGSRKTGRLLTMVAAVGPANPGLTDREVLGLVRRTLINYGE